MAYPSETYRGYQLEAAGTQCAISRDGEHIQTVASFAAARGVIDQWLHAK